MISDLQHRFNDSEDYNIAFSSFARAPPIRSVGNRVPKSARMMLQHVDDRSISEFFSSAQRHSMKDAKDYNDAEIDRLLTTSSKSISMSFFRYNRDSNSGCTYGKDRTPRICRPEWIDEVKRARRALEGAENAMLRAMRRAKTENNEDVIVVDGLNQTMIEKWRRLVDAAEPLTFQKPVTLELLLDVVKQQCDVVVANIGLHFGMSKKDFQWQKKIIQTLSDINKKSVCDHPRIGIWRETTPQHFHVGDNAQLAGDYHAWRLTLNVSTRKTDTINEQGYGYACWPYKIEQPYLSNPDVDIKFHRMVTEFAKRKKVSIMHVRRALSSRYDAHVEHRSADLKSGGTALDCTHWCRSISEVHHSSLLHVLTEKLNKNKCA